MANLTVNTKKYGQITLNTKPHSDPLELKSWFSSIQLTAYALKPLH